MGKNAKDTFLSATDAGDLDSKRGFRVSYIMFYKYYQEKLKDSFFLHEKNTYFSKSTPSYFPFKIVSVNFIIVCHIK